MNWLALLQWLLGSGIISSGSQKQGAAAEKLQQLHSAGGVLWSQAGLLRRLAGVEWLEQKARLRGMLIAGLAGFIFLLCTLLFIGVLVVTLAWDTQYRYWAPLLMVVLYAIGALVAVRALIKRLSNGGEEAFAATRKELMADVMLVKEKLWP